MTRKTLFQIDMIEEDDSQSFQYVTNKMSQLEFRALAHFIGSVKRHFDKELDLDEGDTEYHEEVE